jgi:hypothetical protein
MLISSRADAIWKCDGGGGGISSELTKAEQNQICPIKSQSDSSPINIEVTTEFKNYATQIQRNNNCSECDRATIACSLGHHGRCQCAAGARLKIK